MPQAFILKLKTMKLISTLLIAVALFTTLSTSAKMYEEYGSSRFYDLKSGDTLVINSGEYRGRIQNNESGWVLIVRQHALFSPSNFSGINGQVFNYGTITLNQSLSTANGFSLENYGAFNVYANALFNGDQQVTIHNRANGNMYFGNSIDFNAPVTMVNDGLIVAAQNITLNSGTVITNNNSITVNGTLSLNNGRIINNKRLNIKRRFTINSGSSLINNALTIAEGGITNNSTLVNSGLLWVSATDNNDFINSGSITMMPNAMVRTGSFTNNSAVDGEGTLYMLNHTVHNGSGSIGSNDNTAGQMIVHDATRTRAIQFFDNQWGAISRNVVYRQVAEPDTATYAASKFVVLPIKWHSFTAQLQAASAQLTWKATDDVSALQFTIERSVNGQQFTAIGTTTGTAYTDASLPAGAAALYYRIKATSASGEVKYSEVRMVKLVATATAPSLNLWPNPTVQNVNISYNSTSAQALIIVVKNMSGQNIIRKTATAHAGANHISLSELAAQGSGYYVVELWSANSLLASGKVVKR